MQFHIGTVGGAAAGGTELVPTVRLWTECGKLGRYSHYELTPTKPGVQLGAEGNCTPGLCPGSTCLHNLNPASIQWHELLRTRHPTVDKTSCESCSFIVALQMLSAACMNSRGCDTRSVPM